VSRSVAMRCDSGNMARTLWYMTPISLTASPHSMPSSSAAAKVCAVYILRVFSWSFAVYK